MKKLNYRCEFRFGRRDELRYVRGSCLADFKDGFWVDADVHFTKGSAAAFWIPHKIIYVQKEAS